MYLPLQIAISLLTIMETHKYSEREGTLTRAKEICKLDRTEASSKKKSDRSMNGQRRGISEVVTEKARDSVPRMEVDQDIRRPWLLWERERRSHR